jgi:RNA polymerase sigma-70 factor, ECF subfamily
MALNTDQRRRDRFERLVLPHLDAAWVLARWLTRNQDDAGDVVQEAFLRALRYFDSYREGDAKAWLLKIVRHTCYSWLARNRPKDLLSLDAEAEYGDEIAAVSVDGDALQETRSDLRRLHALMMTLPAPLREMLVLREFHELGYRDIAEVTGVPIGTVMSRLYRARSQLLDAYDVAPPDSYEAVPQGRAGHAAATRLAAEHRGANLAGAPSGPAEQPATP